MKYINKLKDNPNDVATMKQIFSTYGTHIITHGTLGGELKLSMQMKVTDDTSDSDIHAALGLGAKVIDVSGEFSMTEKEKAIAAILLFHLSPTEVAMSIPLLPELPSSSSSRQSKTRINWMLGYKPYRTVPSWPLSIL